MEETTLVIDRQKKIKDLCNNLLSMSNGKDIVGDGKHLVTDAEFAKITHEFTDGIYMRRMDIYANAVVVGAIWKHEHFCFLLEGNITVADKHGVQDYIAPCYVRSMPGAQRVIHAHEDSIFINVHKNPTNTRDLEEVESYICSLTLEEYDKYINNKELWQD
jgi:hypothetical protein